MKGFETPNECIERAAEAIKLGHESGILKGHLCFFGCSFAYRQNNHTTVNHAIIMNIDHKMASEGLSTDEWNQLNTNLWNFFKELI